MTKWTSTGALIVLVFAGCSRPSLPVISDKAEPAHSRAEEGALRPPSFKAPRGHHYAASQLLPDDIYNRCMGMIDRLAFLGTEKWEQYQLSDSNYATMEALLSDGRLVGDGSFVDVGDAGGAWGLSLYGVPAQTNPKLRLYLYHGPGLSKEELLRTYGKRRIETRSGAPSDNAKGAGGVVVIYGRSAVMYDAKSRFFGVAFYCSTSPGRQPWPKEE